MPGMKINRRDFLRRSLVTAGGATLAGCSTIDRFFSTDRGVYEQEVIIVGAGLAGLSAAYELKKRKIPYRIFEASDRIGGRVYTLNHFNDEEQFGELGAEFVSPRHQAVFDLCAELNLPIDAVEDPAGLEAQLYLDQGRIFSRKEMGRELQPLLSRLIRIRLDLSGDSEKPWDAFVAGASAKAQEWDQLSLEQLLNRFEKNVPAVAVRALRRACWAQFGVEPDRQSCLHLLMSLDLESRGGSPHRVRGGMSVLTRTLYERVQGVLPDFFVRLKTPLVAIRDIGTGFECRFHTPEGHRWIQARAVILAVPPTALRQVDGWVDLRLAPIRQQALAHLQLAQHGRVLLGFKNRLWRSKGETVPASLGAVVGDFSQLSFWEGSRGLEGKSGVLAFGPAGATGGQLGANAPEQALNDAMLVWKKLGSERDGRVAQMNWTQRNFVGGSTTVYAPGEFTKYNGIWEQPELGGRLCFAGEHTSAFFHGTMQGAVESGKRAALQIVQALPKRSGT